MTFLLKTSHTNFNDVILMSSASVFRLKMNMSVLRVLETQYAPPLPKTVSYYHDFFWRAENMISKMICTKVG